MTTSLLSVAVLLALSACQPTAATLGKDGEAGFLNTDGGSSSDGGSISDGGSSSDGGSTGDGGSDGDGGGTRDGGSSTGDGGSDGGGGSTGDEALPDFVLTDINPNSPRFGQAVSPRDYLEQVSGWYFTHAT